uniref:Peptidase_M13 domain-containing protein n=1 Tax=Panagrellus redivivus TaxID=6233 RepID=A0A7E4VJK6_PANRE
MSSFNAPPIPPPRKRSTTTPPSTLVSASVSTKNWYFRNPAHAFFPSYALMRSSDDKNHSFSSGVASSRPVDNVAEAPRIGAIGYNTFCTEESASKRGSASTFADFEPNLFASGSGYSASTSSAATDKRIIKDSQPARSLQKSALPMPRKGGGTVAQCPPASLCSEELNSDLATRNQFIISRRNRSYTFVFVALFVFVLIVAITFLIALALLTDGFKHITVDQRCRQRWNNMDTLPKSDMLDVAPNVRTNPLPAAEIVPKVDSGEKLAPRQPLPSAPVRTSNKNGNSGEKGENICLEAECVRIAANILTHMNNKIDPCDSFYNFACGGYSAIKQVPESEKKISVLTEARSRLRYEIKELLDDSDARAEDSSDLAKLVHIYYDSCMDDLAQDSLDLMPVFSLLSSFGGWALLQNARFEERDFHWEGIEGNMQMLGLDGMFSLAVKPIGGNKSVASLSIGPPKLLLGDRRLYALNLGRNEFLQNYRTYMMELIELMGADTEVLEPQINDILNFERKLANITVATVKSVQLSLSSLKIEAPEIAWKYLFNTVFAELPEGTSDEGDTDAIPFVVDMDYLQRLSTLLSNTKSQTINDYLMWKLIASFDLYLPQRYRTPHETLNTILRGVTVKPLWEECVNEVSDRMALPLAAMYARWYAGHRNVKAEDDAVDQLITDLRDALGQTLLNADWMDEATRAMAIGKLHKMKVSVDVLKGQPNEASVLQMFAGVRLVGNSYFDNNVAIRKAAARADFKKLRTGMGPRSGDFLGLLADLVPLHRYSSNEIILPSGLLQFPFFVSEAPPSISYGSFGAMLVREITHGFDDFGSNFDEDGLRRPWWQPATNKFFDSKKQCFIAQYDSKNEPLTGKQIDGKRTLRENIADNGALRTAYAAYNLHITRDSDSLKLPALTNFTEHQMYFIAFANTFCESVKVNSAQQLLASELTSPGAFRVDVPLQNFPAFAQAFNCPIGSGMNPYEKCRIW